MTLDTVVFAFSEGLSAEEIAEQYSGLELADVYAGIAYFLRHRSYLAERQSEGASVREQNGARFSQRDLRERLLARRAGERGDL